MVWCGLWARWNHRPIFFQKRGRPELTVNGDRYLANTKISIEMLRPVIDKWNGRVDHVNPSYDQRNPSYDQHLKEIIL